MNPSHHKSFIKTLIERTNVAAFRAFEENDKFGPCKRVGFE